MSRASQIMIFLVLALAAGGVWWWRHQEALSTAAVPIKHPGAPTAPPAPAVPAPAVTPAIRYPVPVAQPARGALPSLDAADDYVKNALVGLLGRKAVLSFLHIDGFIRGFVATVSNLGTDNAPAHLWPVNTTAGPFEVGRGDGGTTIGAKNADRYAPFVHFVEGIDTERAVALYVRLYPLFQAAYDDLGLPGRYFNDRVIQVIDDLLATPTVAGPIRVKHIEADGAPPTSERLYVFEDPALEARSAGQKILLRIGHENALVLMAKLTDVRQRLVGAAVTRHP